MVKELWKQILGMEEERRRQLSTTLPPSFLIFLKNNGIDPDAYIKNCSIDIPRFFRVVRGRVTHEDVLKHFPSASLITWFGSNPAGESIYSVPSCENLSSNPLHKDGKILGIDVSSVAAVAALDVKPGHTVLDLCCAPGAKLCTLGDIVGPNGRVTGVDVAEQRLNACRNLVRRLDLKQTTNVHLADGTKFPQLLPVPIRKKKNRKKRPLVDVNDIVHEEASKGYDRVLVDAECTHDGSIKHITKFEQWGWETFEEKFFDEKRISTLQMLQRELLQNGFRHLKDGGVLVYSTCSFARAQNEDIVDWFLSVEPRATIQEVPERSLWPCKEGFCPGTLRFEPDASGTSGLFLARFVKAEEGSEPSPGAKRVRHSDGANVPL